MKNFQKIAWCLILIHQSFFASHIDPTSVEMQHQKCVEQIGQAMQINSINPLLALVKSVESWAADGEEEFIENMQKNHENNKQRRLEILNQKRIAKILDSFKDVFQAPCVDVIPVVKTIRVYHYLPSKKLKSQKYVPEHPLQFHKEIHALCYDLFQSCGQELIILQENIKHKIFAILDEKNIEFMTVALTNEHKVKMIYNSKLLYWKISICS